MPEIRVRGFLLGLGIFLCASDAAAADRHVFLDTNADGILNQCPNPEHNTFASPSSGNLQYCVCAGGVCTATTMNGKVLGDKAGYVTSGACTAAGGTVQNVVNGGSADILGNGTSKALYGHPQACVWAMNTSDSCEVHAGTYRTSGAYADSNALDAGTAPGSGCDKNNCWFATVVAPGPASGGAYGTASAPGYLRGAVMKGSIDSWDPNGDKNPADGGYPAIFSGDRNSDGGFDATTGGDGDNNGSFTGLGASFRGDAFVGVLVGCEGTESSGYTWCGTGHSDNPWIDTDANGTFDRRGNIGSRNPAYLVIKDLEFKGYNGGINVANAAGIRAYSGIINLPGNGSSDGLVVDHVYVHGNDFSYTVANENFWTIIDDSHNKNCTRWTEIKNSHFEQNNNSVMDDDCGVGNECGCPKHFHDNLVVRNLISPRATTDLKVFFYLKSIDTFNNGTKKKVHRIWNNEFVLSPTTSQSGKNTFMDLQAFGNSTARGQGELWVYGNVFRALGTPKMTRFWLGFCGVGTGSFRTYFFNNTFDMTFLSNDDGVWAACGGEAGEKVVEKNNAYWSGTTAIGTHQSQGATLIRANEFCSATDTACTRTALTAKSDWFAGTAPTAYDGPRAYAAKNGGALYRAGSCDPDGDGTPGVDYDGDGVNDTSWRDLAGNTVSCPATNSPIDAGAIQSGTSGPVDTTPPANVTGAKRIDRRP